MHCKQLPIRYCDSHSAIAIARSRPGYEDSFTRLPECWFFFLAVASSQKAYYIYITTPEG